MENGLQILLLSIMAGIVPTLAYVGFVWMMDRYEREPLALLTVTFIWGAIPAVLLSFLVEGLFGWPLSTLQQANADLLASSVVAPIVEELMKGLALAGLFVFFRAEFDDVLDGIVYGALIGLGFGMTENVAYFLRSFQEGGWTQWLTTVVGRSIFFGLTHAFYTGMMGALWGYARLTQERSKRWLFPLLGLGIAIAFHAFHNVSLSLFSGFFLALISDWLGVLLLFALIVLSRRREAAWIVQELEEEVALGVLSPEEYATLPSYRRRVASYRQYQRQGGWSVLQKGRRLIQQATELAFKKHQQRQQGATPKSEAVIGELRAHILALRQEMGHGIGVPLVCTSCGQRLRDEQRFCTRCGQRLGTLPGEAWSEPRREPHDRGGAFRCARQHLEY